MLKPIGISVGGADPKMWVTDGKKEYLLKSAKIGNELMPYSEFVCSRFMKFLGIPAQDVELINYKGKLWAKCGRVEQFTHYLALQESSPFHDESRGYSMEDILHVVANFEELSGLQRYNLLVAFKRLYLLDAITANSDRHAGNWGYNSNGKLCTVYDNGAALYPNIEVYLKEKTVYDLLYRIVVLGPRSSVRFNNEEYESKKFTFYQAIGRTELLQNELDWVAKQNVYGAIIYAVEPLPVRMKRFYHYLVYMRYRCVVLREDFDKAFKGLKKFDYPFPESVDDFCKGLDKEGYYANNGRFARVRTWSHTRLVGLFGKGIRFVS